MNSLLETLNVWAGYALRFAWPMLWQSSLLIGVLFALDLVLRKKLRPALRYALWLVVVVKVLLPPSLAFPTGPSWWLRPVKLAPAQPRPTPVVVTYSTDDQPVPLTAMTPVLMTPYRPRLSATGWAFAGMVGVSLGLFAWMLVRWYQVARDARRAVAAPAWLGELLPERQRPARIRLTDRPQSPAACGLFRPVILLPRALADHLPPGQLRAVLLHELVHLRRGDVWVNCVQALVQILYWWHPLLWLANARIRRVREEAVDDAVMLALNEDAETYAPTLLEVAKLSLHRPLASLGLVGILESRSSLRQRIERLLDFHPPRRAGLTLGSVLAVLGFAALAVPMGEAPAPSEVPQSAPGLVADNRSASNNPSNAGSAAEQELKASTLVYTGPGRQAIIAKLNGIRLANVSYDGLPLGEVVQLLNDESKKRDPEGRGVAFLLNGTPDGGDLSSLPITIKPPLTNIRLAEVLDAIVKVGGWPIKYWVGDYSVTLSAKTGQEAAGLCIRTFKVNPNTLIQGLHRAKARAVTKGSEAVARALRDYLAREGVDLDPSKNPGKSLLFDDRQGVLVIVATWQDLCITERALRMLNVVPPQVNIKCKFVEVSQDDTKALGIDWYLGNMLMNNSAIAGQAGSIPSFNGVPTSVNPLGGFNAPTVNLTDPQFRVLLKALQQRSGAELLAQPEITISSGRQGQMKTTTTQRVVTGVNERALTAPGITTTNGDESPLYVAEPIEFGQTLDVIASVLDDGYTIELKMTPTVIEFLGYVEDPTNRVAVYVNGNRKLVTLDLPQVRRRQMSANVQVRDGQTVVLKAPPAETMTPIKGPTAPMLSELPLATPAFRIESATTNKKTLLIFVTPTLIDPAGNLIHAPEEMPLPRGGTPPQPAR